MMWKAFHAVLNYIMLAVPYHTIDQKLCFRTILAGPKEGLKIGGKGASSNVVKMISPP